MKVFSVSTVFIAVCLFGTALAASGRVGTPGFSCTPGEHFNDACNSCTCGQDGKQAACTFRYCGNKRDVGKPKLGEPGYCTPGSSFRDEEDCNTCTCLPDGKNAVCTLKLCTKPKRESPPMPTPAPVYTGTPGRPGFTCIPGQNFIHHCLKCNCDSDGITATCSMLGKCRPLRQAPAPVPNTPGFKCTPGSTFNHECNTCNCGPDGETAVCTLSACPEYRQKEKRDTGSECQDGETKVEDCNNCNCVKGNWACTRRVCAKPPVKREVACQDGETKEIACNTCTCGGGEWGCTRKVCPKVKRQAECEDGASKKEDCNMCHCAGGKWGCTRRFCPKTKREAECEDGASKKEDCNMCHCAGGKWGCTRRFCPKNKREEPVDNDFNGTTCTPNDKFEIDCNTCYCNSDGNGYSCTEKYCASTKENTTTTAKSDTEQ